VGLSDHSSTIYPSLAAVALGASVVEVHVTLSREMFGPDVKASVTMAELRQICDGARCIRTMLSSEINKDVMAGEFTALRQIFTKSIVARVGLPAGTILQEDHLAFKKPGTGLPPSRANELLGRKVKRPVKQDSLLSLDDCE
jgi:N-acetylneuraminate synthase